MTATLMTDAPLEDLSRRERQVMDAVYSLGEATVRQVVRHLGDPEAYDSIRVTMANLAGEGRLDREREGRAYVYAPAVPRDQAGKGELSRLLRTFFGGSTSRAMRAFLDVQEEELDREELEEIAAWIDQRARERDD